ncbi:coproporphyrinogen III oxidase family protein [Helicobacter aurati]|uniref:Heme chaperone HemW n=1 Tax=Helicobacter aurati TaxID=137778 RepID=A0A3D8J2U5_9HELI|nr:radical SAM family heme chaperone HemW [Helicobacter aurati]RDU71580.1 coproporphyrinogen III oxidase family protein [Helicobacter aurati]
MRIYIHVPFCDSKCGYCAFFSQTHQEHLIDDYFRALYHEIESNLSSYNIKHISSIFIGGGTPNLIKPQYYEKIFALLLPLCNLQDSPNNKACKHEDSNNSSLTEITIESNPNNLGFEWLHALHSFGVNRISLGVQSFYADKLALLQREHSLQDIQYAFDVITRIFDNVSLDLIYDCQLDSQHRLQHELESALQLGISHLSAYSLSIDKDSHFAKTNQHHLLRKESLGVFVRDFLCTNGALHYEVSNFAIPKKCKHNLGYWNSEEYLGFGASAVSRVGQNRKYAPKNLQKYIANPLHKTIEKLSKTDLEFEEIFLGLRSEVGVRETLLNQEKLPIVLNNKLCYKKDSRIYANNLFLADELTLYLC